MLDLDWEEYKRNNTGAWDESQTDSDYDSTIGKLKRNFGIEVKRESVTTINSER